MTPLTVDSLIDLLEKQRCTFTDRYCPLLKAQEIALRKANDLIAEDLGSLSRNYPRKKAHMILNDIKICVSHDVFVLCALATNPSGLGNSKLKNYVPEITIWWARVDHPRGLTTVSVRYRMITSKALPNNANHEVSGSSAFLRTLVCLSLTLINN
jgi:hypothetical protein